MRSTKSFLACLAFAATALMSTAQAFAAPSEHAAPTTASEARAAKAYQGALQHGPEALRGFLTNFPKGADLHVHLAGAVYAESFIRAAGEDGLCVDPEALKFVKAPCAAPLLAASEVPHHQELYDRLVDAFSMRTFIPVSGWSGHDQFFATFDRFGGLGKKHAGEWVDEVASLAAAQNQQYLELMQTPPYVHAAQIAKEIGWNPDFAQMRQALLDHGIGDEIAADREDVSTAEAKRRQIERCGTPEAVPACQVEVRYIYQILREFPPEHVFAQTLLGFETIQASMDAHEPTWVGINFVQPEDGFISMRDYTLQMKMVEYLHSVYPKVHITLHAGELTLGLVPPEGVRFHIRQAVELGHAERIGHGVDVMFEDDAKALLKELAEKHVMVEINLTSNEGILGVRGIDHPFPLYLEAHVPVALSTDDEGVSRMDLTHEYVRAANDYHLSYGELKELARTGMEHDFLPGNSLWAVKDAFTVVVPQCKGQVPGIEKPSSACAAFLKESEKAAAQWELERRFRAFEASY